MPRGRAILLVCLLAGCGNNRSPAAGNADFGDDTGVAGDVGIPGAKADSFATDVAGHEGGGDVSADAGATPDAGLDVGGEVADSSGIDSKPDLGPPVDAPTSEGKPTDSSDSYVCDTELAWWAQNAKFDASAGSPDFVTELNALIAASDHPITLADQRDSVTRAWTLQTSATTLGGDFAQHFPVGNGPSAPVAMSRTPRGFSSGSLQDSAWIHAIDAASPPADVWIPIVQVSTTATYGGSACQTLAGAAVRAVVPSSAASVTLTTKSGATTLGALLGPETSSAPPGWNIELAFDATKVGVSFQ